MNHPTLYAAGRYGCWATCMCGDWKSRTWTSIAGAHLDFGTHLLDTKEKP